jgi:hypothetical protein
VIYGNVFLQTISILYGNPILFIMPTIGFLISVTIEVAFVIGLYNDNTQYYLLFSNILVVFLFFIGFIITFFQVVITRNIVLKKTYRSNNSLYHLEILVIFMIYSIYALILVQMGGYESDIRKSYVAESDRFSLYTFKIKSYDDMISIIPSGTILIIFSAIFSTFFNSWMVTSMCRYQSTNMYIFYESLRDVIHIITKREDDKKKKMTSLFILTSIISVVGFILANTAVFPLSSSLNLYLSQFVISNIIGTFYSPFFLLCLFLILSPRMYV